MRRIGRRAGESDLRIGVHLRKRVPLLEATGRIDAGKDGAGQGGLPFLHAIPAWIWGLVNIGIFLGKVVLLLFIFIWVRWTLPRFRYDQLMDLGWKALIPLALGWMLLLGAAHVA